ncbi:hypothetical protein GCM10009000_109150 [Halobacterium noricense]
MPGDWGLADYRDALVRKNTAKHCADQHFWTESYGVMHSASDRGAESVVRGL